MVFLTSRLVKTSHRRMKGLESKIQDAVQEILLISKMLEHATKTQDLCIAQGEAISAEAEDWVSEVEFILEECGPDNVSLENVIDAVAKLAEELEDQEGFDDGGSR